MLTSSFFHQILYNVEMSVEACRPQGSRVGLGGGVDVGAALGQHLDDGAVSGGGGAPQGRCSLNGLAVESDGAGLLHVG